MEGRDSSCEGQIRREAFYEKLRVEYAARYKEFDPLSVQALFSLIQTYIMSEARLGARIQERGITLSGLNVLSILRRYGKQGCPLNELSRWLLVSRANITGLMDSLVRKRYVVRQDHATDRRVILAKITKAGDAFLDSYFPEHYAEIRKMFSGLNKNEKVHLNNLLTKLRRTSCPHPREEPSRAS